MARGAFRSRFREIPWLDLWTQGWFRYAFLEGGEAVDLAALTGPSGFPFSAPASLQVERRFRFSTIAAGSFDALEAGVPPLGPNPDRRAREQRRRALQEVFGAIPMPVFDVFAPPGHALIPDLESSPSGWFQMVVQPGPAQEDELFALMGDPDDGGEDIVCRVMSIFPANHARPRLRDVFSLAHIGDLGDDEDGGEPEPTPEPPPGGGSVLVVGQQGVRWTTQDIEVVKQVTEWDPLTTTQPAQPMIRITL